MALKIRMIQQNVKQIDILKILSARGIQIDAGELSRALNELPQERYEKIRKAVDEILTEMEAEK